MLENSGLGSHHGFVFRNNGHNELVTKFKKGLSAPGLLESVRKRFGQIKDPLEHGTKYLLVDCLMSALGMFSMKFPSLLRFDRQARVDGLVKHNLKSLFGVVLAPSDTYMRERLDTVLPKYMRRAFKCCLSAVQRGKALCRYHFLDDYILVSNDGTGFFSSHDIHCQHCCEKKHKDGTVTYHHQIMSAVIVHPEEKVVLPLSVEPILKQDGDKKNDCERNASKRLLTALRHMHPKLKMVIVEDGLHSNAPHINVLKSLDYRYIIGAKPKDHKWLFDWVNAGGCETMTRTESGVSYQFRWQNNVPLNESNHELKVNFLECIVMNKKGKQTTFSWVTDFQITQDNVFRLMQGGRARWKIENETFNTIKTQGYEFEHNFGHGKNYLSTIFANLMMLVFLIDQIQQLCCPKFQAALKKCVTKRDLWERMRSWFMTFIIDSWEIFFDAIAKPPRHFHLTPQPPDTS